MSSVEQKQKIGIILPTFNRPDVLRSCVLQLMAQSRRPDIICVHQNGTKEGYAWCVQDLGAPIVWMHSPAKIAQNLWYRIPLDHLIRENCTHYFWIDHDDIYLRNHIETCVSELEQGYDFRISAHCGVIVARPHEYQYSPNVLFDDIHATGGMSSSMAFKRSFAEGLSADLQSTVLSATYSDEVVANKTMPRFKCLRSSARTTIYLSHKFSVSSTHWLDLETNFKKFPG